MVLPLVARAARACQYAPCSTRRYDWRRGYARRLWARRARRPRARGIGDRLLDSRRFSPLQFLLGRPSATLFWLRNSMRFRNSVCMHVSSARALSLRSPLTPIIFDNRVILARACASAACWSFVICRADASSRARLSRSARACSVEFCCSRALASSRVRPSDFWRSCCSILLAA